MMKKKFLIFLLCVLPGGVVGLAIWSAWSVASLRKKAEQRLKDKEAR